MAKEAKRPAGRVLKESLDKVRLNLELRKPPSLKPPEAPQTPQVDPKIDRLAAGLTTMVASAWNSPEPPTADVKTVTGDLIRQLATFPETANLKNLTEEQFKALTEVTAQKVTEKLASLENDVRVQTTAELQERFGPVIHDPNLGSRFKVSEEPVPADFINGYIDGPDGRHVQIRDGNTGSDIYIREDLLTPDTYRIKKILKSEEFGSPVASERLRDFFTVEGDAPDADGRIAIWEEPWEASQYAFDKFGATRNVHSVRLPSVDVKSNRRPAGKDEPGSLSGTDRYTVPAPWVEVGTKRNISGPQDIEAYHGTRREFTRPEAGKESWGAMDRLLGPHFAPDPIIANAFAGGTGGLPGGNIHKTTLRSKGTYILPQREGLFDQDEIQRDIARVVFPRRKDLFVKIISKVADIPPEETGQIWDEIMTTGVSTMSGMESPGVTVSRFAVPGGRPYIAMMEKGFGRWADRHHWMPDDHNLQTEVVAEYKKALAEQGYDVLSYRNTMPSEVGEAKTPESLIVLDENIIRGHPLDKVLGKWSAQEFDQQHAEKSLETLALMGIAPRDVLEEFSGKVESVEGYKDNLVQFFNALKAKDPEALAAVRKAYFKNEPSPGTKISQDKYGLEEDAVRAIGRVIEDRAEVALIPPGVKIPKEFKDYDLRIADLTVRGYRFVANKSNRGEEQLAEAINAFSSGNIRTLGKLQGWKQGEINVAKPGARINKIAMVVGEAKKFIEGLKRPLQKQYATEVDKFIRGERPDEPAPPKGMTLGEINNIATELGQKYDIGNLFGMTLHIGSLLGSYFSEDDEDKKNLMLASAMGAGMFSRRFIGKMTPGMLRALGELDVHLSKRKNPVKPDEVRKFLLNRLVEMHKAGEPIPNANEFLNQATKKIVNLHNNRVSPPPAPPPGVTEPIPDDLKPLEPYQHDRYIGESKKRPNEEEGYTANIRTEGRFGEEGEKLIEDFFANSLPPGAVEMARGNEMKIPEVLKEAQRVYTEVVAKAWKGEYGPRQPLRVEELAALQAGVVSFAEKTAASGQKPTPAEERGMINLLLTLSGGVAETGRTLGWLKRPFDPRLRELVADLKKKMADPKLQELLDHYVEKGTPPPGWEDYVVSWARNMKLFSLSSVIRSFGGNTIMQMLKMLEAPATAAANRALSAVTGKTRDRFATEALYYKSGFINALPKAWQDAWKVVKGEQFSTMHEREFIHRLQTIPGKFGKAVETPTRAQGGVDVLFRHAAEEGHLMELAARDGLQKGLSGPDLALHANKKVAEFRDNMKVDNIFRPEWVRRWSKDIQEHAERLTFQSKGGRIMKSVNRVRRDYPFPMQVIVPFFNAWANIFKVVLEYSPLAPLTQSFRNGILSAFAEEGAAGERGRMYAELVKRAEKTGEPIDTSIGPLSEKLGRMGTGAALGALTAFTLFKVLDGEVTGAGPENKEERRRMMELGWKPYSIYLGGNRIVGYRGMEPLSSWLAMLADFKDGYKKGGAEAAFNVTKNLAKNFADNPFLLGVTDVVDALRGDTDYIRAGAGIIVSSVMPNIMRQVARTIDPVIRETENPWTDEFLKQIPGASLSLLPRRGILGQEISQQNPALRMFALDIGSMPDDVVLRELKGLSDRLGKTYGLPGDVIEGIPLDKRTHNELVRIAGENFATAARQFINSEAYQSDQLTDGEKDKAFSIMQSRIHQAIRQAFFSRYIIQGKIEQLRPFFQGGRFGADETEGMNSTLNDLLQGIDNVPDSER